MLAIVNIAARPHAAILMRTPATQPLPGRFDPGLANTRSLKNFVVRRLLAGKL
jgi:hypothetical protein